MGPARFRCATLLLIGHWIFSKHSGSADSRTSRWTTPTGCRHLRPSLPDCVVKISKSSSNSVVAMIADSVVVDCKGCLSAWPQSAGNVGLVVSIFGVDTVVDPKTARLVKLIHWSSIYHLGSSDCMILKILTKNRFRSLRRWWCWFLGLFQINLQFLQ